MQSYWGHVELLNPCVWENVSECTASEWRFPKNALLLRAAVFCFDAHFPFTWLSACLKVNGDSNANQCSYGETSRTAIRGGQWIATVADFPQSSLYVSILDRSCCAYCHLLIRSQAYPTFAAVVSPVHITPFCITR